MILFLVPIVAPAYKQGITLTSQIGFFERFTQSVIVEQLQRLVESPRPKLGIFSVAQTLFWVLPALLLVLLLNHIFANSMRRNLVSASSEQSLNLIYTH